MTTDPVTVERPKHPLHALTTYELADYRRLLEKAIAFFDEQDPGPCGPGQPASRPRRSPRRAGRPQEAGRCL